MFSLCAAHHLIVVNQLLERDKLPLPDAVHPVLHMHPEMLVPPGSFKRDRKVSRLQNGKT